MFAKSSAFDASDRSIAASIFAERDVACDQMCGHEMLEVGITSILGSANVAMNL